MNKMQIVSVPLVFDWFSFGQACKRCREEFDLTLYQASALMDISRAALDDIENATHGNALMSTVLAAANLYDLDIRVYFILADTRLKYKMRRKRADVNRPKFEKNKIRAQIKKYSGL